MNRERPSRFPKHYSDIRSAASDPADFISDAAYPMAPELYNDGIARRDYATEVKDVTDGDADGDDELVTNDEDEEDNATNNLNDEAGASGEAIDEDYFTTPIATRFTNTEPSAADSPRPGASRRIALHHRTLSTNTILYAPEADRQHSDSSASAWPAMAPRTLSRPISSRPTPVSTPIAPRGGDGLRSPRRSLYMTSRPRLTTDTSGSSMARTVPSNHRTSGLSLDIPTTLTTVTSGSRKTPTRRRSFVEFDGLSTADDAFTGAPSSLPTRTSLLSSGRRHSGGSGSGGGGGNTRASRAMMARMKSLEDSLGHMVREMRVLRMSVPNTAHNSDDGLVGGGGGGGIGARPAPQRFSVGSDPSSVGGGGGGDQSLPLIEIAGHGHGSVGRAAGLKRSKTNPRRVPGRRAAATAVGYWRSPSSREGIGSGSIAAAGLGIRGRHHGDGGGDMVEGKGKEKEVRQPLLLPRSSSSFGDSPAMSPDPEEVEGGEGFAKGTSL
ncbi:hypothetical protein MMYC01_201867 [Madurella mycetomatis]|nr:hypothetical protein MMYC01_201867 [Madurella mycetomatis]